MKNTLFVAVGLVLVLMLNSACGGNSVASQMGEENEEAEKTDIIEGIDSNVADTIDKADYSDNSEHAYSNDKQLELALEDKAPSSKEYDSRLQIDDYKTKQIERYEECFVKSGVDYYISANNNYIVGRDTEREILGKKYHISEIACSLFDRSSNLIKNAIEIHYEVHSESGLEKESNHTNLIYQLYSLVEETPIGLDEFIDLVNDALAQKSEEPIIAGSKYKLYLGISYSSVVPSKVYFVYYESIPCKLRGEEDLSYLEFDSMDDREVFIENVDSAVRGNDINVKSYVHEYADENYLTEFQNRLGLVIKYYVYASFNNGIPIEDYRHVLTKQLEVFGNDYIIDDDVTIDDIANEIITSSQIAKYSKETSLYMDYDPSYMDFNKCELQKNYAFNPLRCRQFKCYHYGICGNYSDDFYTSHVYIPAKVQGLKNN